MTGPEIRRLGYWWLLDERDEWRRIIARIDADPVGWDFPVPSREYASWKLREVYVEMKRRGIPLDAPKPTREPPPVVLGPA